MGHGLVLPALVRVLLLVAAPLHVGLSRALHAVVRMGVRLVVELPLLQRGPWLGRLVPSRGLGTAGALGRRPGWRRASVRLVRAGRLSGSDRHREQLVES